MNITLTDCISYIYPKFRKTNINIKHCILKEIPRYFLKSIENNCGDDLIICDELVKSFHSIYCKYCLCPLKKHDDCGLVCFNIDCKIEITDNFISWNMDTYDYCPKCQTPAKCVGYEDVIYYCDMCEWIWTYHDRGVGDKLYNNSEHCGVAEYIGWKIRHLYTDEPLFIPKLMPNIGIESYNTYLLKDYFTKEELIEKDTYFDVDNTTYEEFDVGFDQTDYLRFKCLDCNLVFEIDPTGS